MPKQKFISFEKMAGAGNDFLILEAKKGLNYKKLAPKMCGRTNGVGADGLIIIDRSRKSDYKMRIINADGSEAEMCGNGARCVAAYIVRHKNLRKKRFTIETLAGELLAEAKDQTANVRLSDPTDYKTNVPVTLADRKINVQYIDTGVPHAVIYVEGLEHIDVNGIGALVRYHQKFKPRGANVNFVEQINPQLVAARTYERGVEGETKACGTGSVACALVSYRLANPGTTDKKGARMKVLTASGETLTVKFNLKNSVMSDVWLKGSAKFIAKGEYYL